MSKNYLIDSYELEYAGLALHARYQSSHDQINQRLAGHEFVKVDGAYQELMGSGADGYSFGLVFVGPSWRKDVVAVVAHFKKNPKGLLVHPVHGKKRVGWKWLAPAVEVPGAINSATMQVEFAEDNLDPAAGQPTTGAVYSATIGDQSDQLTTLAATYSAGTVTQVASYVSLAALYASSALAVAQGGIPDPTMPAQLAGVANSATATLAALASDTAAAATLATSRTLTIQVYAAALALDAATAAQRPTIESVTLPGAVSLARLCSDRYGAEAATMRDVVMAMNRIPSPALIAAGTVLSLPAATV